MPASVVFSCGAASAMMTDEEDDSAGEVEAAKTTVASSEAVVPLEKRIFSSVGVVESWVFIVMGAMMVENDKKCGSEDRMIVRACKNNIDRSE